jgi:hypothetical protein
MEINVVISAISFVGLIAIGIVAGLIHNQRRSQAIFDAFANGAYGRLQAQQAPNWRGFVARFDSAPEPYRQFTVKFTAFSYFSLLDFALSNRATANQLLINGRFEQHPRQELIWIRGRSPARALRRGADPYLWVQRRLDLVDGEFAVRGVNTGALEHSFFDLQVRFGPFLKQVQVTADNVADIEIRLKATELNIEHIAALMTTLRMLAKAALLK